MKTQDFGTRLRQLRKQAGMTQRELADLVSVDFSYLSKIESNAAPPPSEKVISQLAKALNADQDELAILAGRVPADIAPILRNRETLIEFKGNPCPVSGKVFKATRDNGKYNEALDGL